MLTSAGITARYANTLMVTLNNRAFMHAQPSEFTIKRSPLVLHMTSRQGDGFGSNAVDVGGGRPVEVTLPPTTDDAFSGEVRGFSTMVIGGPNGYSNQRTK